MIGQFALIVGAMKCGTTSLRNYLAEHPELAPCSANGARFFSDDSNWARGLDWYESLFDFNPHIHRLALEACPSYTMIPFAPDCAERIASTGRIAKIIYTIRDPIARIESHYTMARAHRWEETERGPSEGLHPKVIAYSSYAMQIERYYEHFDPANIKIVLLDDLRANPKRQLVEICRFLGITEDHHFAGLDKTYKASRQMTQAPRGYRALTRKGTVKKLIDSIPGKRWIGRRLLGFGQVSPIVLSDEQKEEALGLLKEDMMVLRDRYGIDTTRWQKP